MAAICSRHDSRKQANKPDSVSRDVEGQFVYLWMSEHILHLEKWKIDSVPNQPSPNRIASIKEIRLPSFFPRCFWLATLSVITKDYLQSLVITLAWRLTRNTTDTPEDTLLKFITRQAPSRFLKSSLIKKKLFFTNLMKFFISSNGDWERYRLNNANDTFSLLLWK